MKTLILIGILAITGCSKSIDNSKCWRCSGNVPATGQTITKDTCTPSGAEPTKITDGNGNDANFTCTHK